MIGTRSRPRGEATREIAPQPGAQSAFLSTPADIAVYGGAAGGGKSYALLMEPLRHVTNGAFGGVIFRRTFPQITNEGGLWDTSSEIYPLVGAVPRNTTLEWYFPAGSRIKFAHMQQESDRFQWDGSQIPYIGFDQLEHFGWRPFFYMLSRNRSTCGVKPYVRASANPDPESWLASFMAWWIDQKTGYALSERSGVIRWFVMHNNAPDWDDDPAALRKRHPGIEPKSFTFIKSSIYDNRILLEKDPGYLANLQALPLIDRLRLLGGNWKTRDAAGMFFKREWFQIVRAAPRFTEEIRYWDRASTPEDAAEPDKAAYTVGLRMGWSYDKQFYITDVVRFRGSPLEVERAVKNIASQDGHIVQVGLEADPGQAGEAEVQVHVRNLSGFVVHVNKVREAKGVRARPLSSQAEQGNVKLVEGPWNDAWLTEAENFDGQKGIWDQIDAASGAFHLLTTKGRVGVW